MELVNSEPLPRNLYSGTHTTDPYQGPILLARTCTKDLYQGPVPRTLKRNDGWQPKCMDSRRVCWEGRHKATA
ncbi:hypothetical protein NQ318_002620 [Aromia moschata]|uniref:Uncharacterized protein n=1 Tax=Aromia moschata TaxID=1265417 RepID=A0AAV8Y8T9_9CUCU|nr:hypothetical protein NQ318_002620 [Aromia moschata]